MRLATLCTNWQRCCLPLHMAVRLNPATDSVQVWTCYSCYAIVESIWSEVVFVRCVTKMDRQKFEQRCAIKFCVKLGESATVTYDDNVETVRSLVRSDHRTMLGMISSELNLNRFTVHQILTRDLDMWKVCAKMVPKNLTTEQKASQRDMCLDLLDRLEREPEFFSRVITGDESWILEYDPRDKTPKSGVAHCKVSLSQESENEQIQNQIDAHLFFWQSGDRPQGICVTRTNCQSNFLLGSPWKVQEKGGMCETRHWTHLDAAPRQCPMSHGSLHQWIFGRKKHSCGSSAPYSPDLNPCDFFLFLRLKYHLKGCQFGISRTA